MKYFPLTTNTISDIDKKLAIKVLNSGQNYIETPEVKAAITNKIGYSSAVEG